MQFEMIPTDLIKIIADYVYDDLNIKLSRTFYDRHLDKVDWSELCRNSTIDVEFFRRHIDKLDWQSLSFNMNFPNELFNEFKDEYNLVDKVSWVLISMNSSVSKEIIINHPNNVYLGTVITYHPMDEEFYERIISEYSERIDWRGISAHASEEFLERMISKYLNTINYINWEWLSYNWRISVDFFIRYIDKISPNSLALYTDISSFFDKIMYSDDLRNIINWDLLSKNTRVGEAFFRRILPEHADKINWHYLCDNGFLSPEFFYYIVSKYPDKIDWSSICGNHRMGPDFFNDLILNSPDKIDWCMLCKNPGVGADFFNNIINTHADKIDWQSLCANIGLDSKFYDQHLDKINQSKSNWCKLSSKDDIKFLFKHLDKVDWCGLSRNCYVLAYEKSLVVKDILLDIL